jgi:hypothetical protein
MSDLRDWLRGRFAVPKLVRFRGAMSMTVFIIPHAALKADHRTILILLVAGSVRAQTEQPVDPTAILEQMIRQQDELEAQRHRNEAMRLELERRDLEDQLRYRRATNEQIAGEMARYCPNGEPPCSMQPPQSLLQEAARRGRIEFKPQQPTGVISTDRRNTLS